jgi:hypothetical protein
MNNPTSDVEEAIDKAPLADQGHRLSPEPVEATPVMLTLPDGTLYTMELADAVAVAVPLYT